MKQLPGILQNIGFGLFYLIILVLFSPAIICVLLYFGIINTVGILARTARKDPKVDYKIKEAYDEKWEYANTPQEFIDSFDSLVEIITKKSNSAVGDLYKEGFEASGDELVDNWADLKIERTIESTQGLILASLNFGFTEINGKRCVELDDEDSRSGSAFPELSLEWKAAKGGRLLLITRSQESIWFAIGLLSSGYRFSKAGQVWVYIPDKKVWLVNYTVISSDKSDRISDSYGSRHSFSEKRVREYWLDD